MSEEAILKEYHKIQNLNKEFVKRVSYDKFLAIIEALKIIDNLYLPKEFQNCDNIVFRNVKIIESCPAIAIRSSQDRIHNIYKVLKEHDESNLFADGFSFLYSDSTNVDKMLSYLKKQSYYPYLGKKTTLLTNGNYDDMVKTSEFFKEIFNQDEQLQFFSRAATVLAQKFNNVKDIYQLLKKLGMSNDKLIFCSSIFTRNDVDKIKSSLEMMNGFKVYFENEAEYVLFIEHNLSILATSKTNQLTDIVSTISKYLNKYPDIFKNITLGDFIKSCSSILARGKADVISSAFTTFEQYDKLSILNQGKRPLVEERGKLCSLLDLFIEEGMESEIDNHTSAFDKNYGSIFSKIGYLKHENIFYPRDQNIVKIVMGKDSHWKDSKYKKLDLYITTLYNSHVNAEKQFKILDNKKYENMIRTAGKNNYPSNEIQPFVQLIISQLDENYKATNNIYLIAGEIISRPKVIRNLAILSQIDELDVSKALVTSILYCKIAGEDVINRITQEISNLNLNKNINDQTQR